MLDFSIISFYFSLEEFGLCILEPKTVKTSTSRYNVFETKTVKELIKAEVKPLSVNNINLCVARLTNYSKKRCCKFFSNIELDEYLNPLVSRRNLNIISIDEPLAVAIKLKLLIESEILIVENELKPLLNSQLQVFDIDNLQATPMFSGLMQVLNHL